MWFASRLCHGGKGLFWGSRWVLGLFCRGHVSNVHCGVFCNNQLARRENRYRVASLHLAQHICVVLEQLGFQGGRKSR